MTEASAAKSRTRFLFIDGLRAVAALAVVVPHAIGLLIHTNANRAATTVLNFVPYFAQGVQVFFLISGFAIAYSLKDATSNPGFTIGRFIVRRAVRLDPPYWAALLIYGLLEAVRALVNHHPVPVPGLGKSIAHIFYLQSLLGFGQFNVVFWTLCLEFQLYLVFAILIRMSSLFRYRAADEEAVNDRLSTFTLGLFVASILVSTFLWPMQRNAGWFIPYFYVFLAGVLACWRTLGRISDAAFASCIGMLFFGCIFFPDPAHITAAVTALTLYVAIRTNALNKWLAWPEIQSIGRISYSIYLLHVPVSLAVGGLRVRLNNESNIVSFAAFAAVYAVTICLSYVFYALVEAPCLRASARLKRSL